MIQTIVNKLRNAGKGWGNAVFDDSRPNNFTVMPCLQVYNIYESPAGEGDMRSFPIFQHWMGIDIWMKKGMSLKQNEKMKKDVVSVLLQVESMVIQRIRNIPDTNHIHTVIEIYCIGGAEDDFRRN